MGIDILYEGAFVLDKPLQPVQRWYLQHFSDNARVTWFEEQVEQMPDPLRVAVGLPVGPDGAYFVGKEAILRNYGLLSDADDPLIKEYKTPSGQPEGRCNWKPSEDGQRIVHNDSEKSFHAKDWLYYLIEHFLRPWGYTLSGQVRWKLAYVEPEHRGTITIEKNVIEDFDVVDYERRVAALQRDYTPRPRRQKKEIVYTGAFVFDTPLEPVHRRYVQRFHHNRRVAWFEEQVEQMPDPLRVAVGLPVGPDGAYFVGKEAVGRASESLMYGTDQFIKVYDIPPRDQPGLWCDWRPSEDGRSLLHDGTDPTVANYEWLYYLIEHFLRPWGYSLSGQVQWEVIGSASEHRGPFSLENKGTITIEKNEIKGFAVDEYDRYLALLQRGVIAIPSQQTMSKQERLDIERNLLDRFTNHPF